MWNEIYWQMKLYEKNSTLSRWNMSVNLITEALSWPFVTEFGGDTLNALI